MPRSRCLGLEAVELEAVLLDVGGLVLVEDRLEVPGEEGIVGGELGALQGQLLGVDLLLAADGPLLAVDLLAQHFRNSVVDGLLRDQLGPEPSSRIRVPVAGHCELLAVVLAGGGGLRGEEAHELGLLDDVSPEDGGLGAHLLDFVRGLPVVQLRAVVPELVVLDGRYVQDVGFLPSSRRTSLAASAVTSISLVFEVTFS